MNKPTLVWLVVAVGALMAGALLGRYVFPDKGFLHQATERFSNEDGYELVNPLLFCGDVSAVLPAEVSDMRSELEDFIAKRQQAGEVSQVSLYFRDLNNGPWFGINEDAEFSPGSLLKVPVMMTILREAEQDPLILTDRILYEGGASNATQLIPVGEPIVAGQEYSVSDLIRAMITQSDNNAALILYEFMGMDKVRLTYTDLGLASPTDSSDYQIKVSQYASFFRLLFNATYLTPERSEEALEILSEAKFTDGIVAGVPEGTIVAHKFGERGYGDGVLQLHDCGIVYLPGKPYTLCIMTRGTTVAGIEGTIEGISRIIYEHLAD